jgi:hypothetical protein
MVIFMEYPSMCARFLAVAALVSGFVVEGVHAHDPHNPHSNRRERNEETFRDEMRVRSRGCRVTGRVHYEEPVFEIH